MNNLINNILHSHNFHKNFYILATFSHLSENITNLKAKDIKFDIIFSNQIIPQSSLKRSCVNRLSFYKKMNYIKIILISGYDFGGHNHNLNGGHNKSISIQPISSFIEDYKNKSNYIELIKYTYPMFFNEENLLNLFSINNKSLNSTYFLFSQTT